MDLELATQQEMRKEAVERLRIIGAHADTIEAFEKKGLIPTTDDTMSINGNVDVSSKSLIRTIDLVLKQLTYLVIYNLDCGISVTAFACVSNRPAEWQTERIAIKSLMGLLHVPDSKGAIDE